MQICFQDGHCQWMTIRTYQGFSLLKEIELCNTNQLRAMPITASQLQHAIQKGPVLSKVMYRVVNGWPKETEPELHALQADLSRIYC